MTAYAGFVGGTYQGTARAVGIEQCMNLIPELGPPHGARPRPMAFYHTPGLREFSQAVGSNPVRDVYCHPPSGRAFFVSGNGFYEVTAGGTTITHSTALLVNTQPAVMVTNGTAGNQILLIHGGLGYIFDTSLDTFTQITDPDFPANVVTAVFIDGYFLVLPYGGRAVYYSALEDGTSWDALDKFEKNQTSDSIVTMIVASKELWLFGSKTTEVYYNTGDALNPFAPIPGVLIESGIAATWSVEKVGGLLCWISQDDGGEGQAWYAKGYSPVRFSTHGVEQQWSTYGGLHAARAWSYNHDGHLFYVVNFDDDDKTWVYDFKTDMWHERGYLVDGEFESHLAANHCFAFSKHLVGSRMDGTIYELAADHYYDDDQPIRRVRRAPHLAPDRSTTVTIDKLALYGSVGDGLATGQGSDPQVVMRYSVDGGDNWSNELFRDMGVRGQKNIHVEWNCLGQGDDWVIEFATSEPIPIAWIGAAVNPEVEAR